MYRYKRRFAILLGLALLICTGQACFAEPAAEAFAVGPEGEADGEVREVSAEDFADFGGSPSPEAFLTEAGAMGEEASQAAKNTAVKRIALPKSITLGVGETRALVPALTPPEADEPLTYSSDKPKYVAVDKDGTLTAKKTGSAKITVRSKGGKRATVTVTVLKKPKALKLNKTSASLAMGAALQLKPVFAAKTGGGVSYSSSDPSVASVDGDGRVTGVARGSATITARTYNGKTAQCEVDVFFDVSTMMTKRADDRLEVLFFDVERNDSILLHCGGEYALVDAGRHAEGEQVSAFLKAHGVKRLKYFIGTHAHGDHVGGAPVILANVRVDKVVVPDMKVAAFLKRRAETSGEKKAVNAARYAVVKPGDTLSLGGAKLRCLGPIQYVKVEDHLEENVNSLIFRVTYGDRALLLPGDATDRELSQVRGKDAGSLRVDVLKNPHHFLTLGEIYEWFGMKHVVVSTGREDPPDEDLVEWMRRLNVNLYVTACDHDGDVLMITDGKAIEFHTARRKDRSTI